VGKHQKLAAHNRRKEGKNSTDEPDKVACDIRKRKLSNPL
jgi:hypothetical protein